MAKGKKPTPQELYWEKKRKEEREKAALLPAGYVNHGNTCFMNSVLQGLVATRPLEDLVRFNAPSTFPLSGSRLSPLLTNGRGPKDCQQDWVQGMELGDTVVQILERSWSMRDHRERSSLSPRELLSRLGTKYDQYLDFRQQDAHEFLIHLLDALRMEEFDIIKQRQPQPRKKSRSRSSISNGSEPTLLDAIPEGERLKSFVDMTFGGKLASVLVCETCKHISHTYEDFDNLSLSITHDESKERIRDRLRTFALKFKSPSRSRDRTRPPQQKSFSQPPSPPLPTSVLDQPEDTEEPRRRSLEIPPSPALTSDIPKNAVNGDGGVGESNQSKTRYLIAGDAGLGKLGRRITLAAGKRDKKPNKAELEAKTDIPDGSSTGGKDSGIGMDKISVSASPGSHSPRPRSLTPVKIWMENMKARIPAEHDAHKAAYLHRLLDDSSATSNPLAALRQANLLTTPGVNMQWTKTGSIQSIEDCLKTFTAVEVLDKENMFSCRNCWKIGNEPRAAERKSEDNSESSEEDDGKPLDESSRQRVVEPIHPFSIPPLSLLGGANSPSSPSIPIQGPISSPSPSYSSARRSDSADTNSTSDTTAASERGLRSISIPTINAISPPPDLMDLIHPPADVSDKEIPSKLPTTANFTRQLGASATSSRNSLQLPPAYTHRRRGAPLEGEGGVSSEESDTSCVSDGDGSVASVPNDDGDRRISLKRRISRSKQVVYRRALKRYLIYSPPPVLIIHLKRFQQVSKSPITLFGNLKKLDEYVSFPEYLDIRPFLAPRKEDYGLRRGEQRGKVVEKGKRAEDQACVYRLYAVVVHIGNMLGGHYISYTALPSSPEPPELLDDPQNKEGGPRGPESAKAGKQGRQWCYISDTVVRLASLDEVLKSKAYICMYERIP